MLCALWQTGLVDCRVHQSSLRWVPYKRRKDVSKHDALSTLTSVSTPALKLRGITLNLVNKLSAWRRKRLTIKGNDYAEGSCGLLIRQTKLAKWIHHSEEKSVKTMLLFRHLRVGLQRRWCGSSPILATLSKSQEGQTMMCWKCMCPRVVWRRRHTRVLSVRG